MRRPVPFRLWLAALLCVGLSGVASAAPAASLPGKSYDYAYDGRDIGHRERAWLGRAYVPPKTAQAGQAVGLVVFLHGLNGALIKHRWMGGGKEGDVRAIVGDLVARGQVAPVVIAGPSSVVASQVTRGASWNHFDLDHFIDRTVAKLRTVVKIDERRIVVAGHSGAGCSMVGGLATASRSKRKLLGILSIDTCMPGAMAQRLAQSPAETHVVVAYQTVSWTKRSFKLFGVLFRREVKKSPPATGVLRAIDHQRPKRAPHDATVALTFERWLPKIVPAGV